MLNIYIRVSCLILFLLYMVGYLCPSFISAKSDFAIVGLLLLFVIPPVVFFQLRIIIRQLRKLNHVKKD